MTQGRGPTACPVPMRTGAAAILTARPLPSPRPTNPAPVTTPLYGKPKGTTAGRWDPERNRKLDLVVPSQFLRQCMSKRAKIESSHSLLHQTVHRHFMASVKAHATAQRDRAAKRVRATEHVDARMSRRHTVRGGIGFVGTVTLDHTSGAVTKQPATRLASEVDAHELEIGGTAAVAEHRRAKSTRRALLLSSGHASVTPAPRQFDRFCGLRV